MRSGCVWSCRLGAGSLPLASFCRFKQCCSGLLLLLCIVVVRVVSDELSKLSGLEPVSPEFNVTRTYLEWLTNLPWGVYSEEVFDINHAQQVRGLKQQGRGSWRW